MAPRSVSGPVVAVIVSYNRRELLLEAVRSVLSQSAAPDAVVVVDNASSDGSADAVRASAPEVDLLELPRNVGGAGGFAVGLARALTEHGAAWVWLMDDDTIPTDTALEELLAATARDSRVAIAGSRVTWTDGQDHPMNTPRSHPFASRAQRREAAAAGGFPVRSSSFVSMLVSGDAVRRSGLPVADYFIWNDDFEFSTRILRSRRGLFVPASVVVHKTAKLGSTDLDPGPRFFYEVRNKLWVFLRSTGLSAPEKVVYAGSTLLRWVRTVARSADRPVLLDGLRRGLRAGITRPRPNIEVLAGLGPASDAVARLEGLQRA